MPIKPPEKRLWSETQAADLQRLAYDAACALSDDLRKAKSCKQRLKIVLAIEKITKCWQDSHASKRALQKPHGTPRNGNGHVSQRTRSAPSLDLSQPCHTQQAVVEPVEPCANQTQQSSAGTCEPSN